MADLTTAFGQLGLAQGLLGQRGLGLAQQSQNLLAAQQQGFTDTTSTDSIDAAALSIDRAPLPTRSRKYGYDFETGETALTWLDRRVEEMRVKL